MLEGRADAHHLRVRLAVHETRETVAVHAAHAGAVREVRLVEADTARRMERMEPGGLELVGEPLDPRLVRDRRKRVRSAGRRLRRILTARAVDLVQVLGLRVVRLELVVGDRPGRRDPVVVPKLAEVLLAKAVERGSVELRRAADEVVDLRLERLPLRVVPGVLRDVAVVDEDVVHAPVRRLASQPVAALEQEDPLSGRGEMAREGAAPGPGPDDHDVVGVHVSPRSRVRATRNPRRGRRPPPAPSFPARTGEPAAGSRSVAPSRARPPRRCPSS